MSAQHTPGAVSEMPFHDGDGYSWGGDIVATIGSRSINLGTSQNDNERQNIFALGRLIAAAPDLLEALKAVDSMWSECDGDRVEPDEARSPQARQVWHQIRAAIAKAIGA